MGRIRLFVFFLALTIWSVAGAETLRNPFAGTVTVYPDHHDLVFPLLLGSGNRDENAMQFAEGLFPLDGQERPEALYRLQILRVCWIAADTISMETAKPCADLAWSGGSEGKSSSLYPFKLTRESRESSQGWSATIQGTPPAGTGYWVVLANVYGQPRLFMLDTRTEGVYGSLPWIPGTDSIPWSSSDGIVTY